VPTCIYCRAQKPEGEFNQEHVMPQAFGHFDTRSPTLLTEVCWDCNQALGDTIETAGTRGSIEGIHRFLTGSLRSVSSLLKTPRTRVSYEVGEHGWDGVRAYLLAGDRDSVKVMFEPQVVVDYHDGKSRSFLLAELNDAEPLRIAKTFRAYVTSDEEFRALTDALDGLGIQPRWTSEIGLPPSEDGKALVKVSAIYDDDVRRLMAKIAFNYLAHVAGARFVLKEDFDPIRRFIRYGDGRGSNFVSPTHEPLLDEEKAAGGWTFTEDHLVAIQREPDGGLFGRVSLFNMIQNVIALCPRRAEIVYFAGIPSGLRFNWKTGEVIRLAAADGNSLVKFPRSGPR
jgi:hypothetical protein